MKKLAFLGWAGVLLGALCVPVAAQQFGLPARAAPVLTLAQSNAQMPPRMTAPSAGEAQDAVNRGELVMRTSFLVFRRAHRTAISELTLSRAQRRQVATLDRNYEESMEKAMLISATASTDEARKAAADRISSDTKAYARALRGIIGQEGYVVYSRNYAAAFERIDQNVMMAEAERQIRNRTRPRRT